MIFVTNFVAYQKKIMSAKEAPVNTEKLFERVTQQSDYKAFEVLFHKYYEYLCNYALKFVPSPQIAEEVVSDVFYKVWKNRERIEIKTSFESYVFKAVKNQSLDFLKSKANAIAYKTESMPVIYDGVTDSPEDQMVIKELDSKIEAAIESLPPQCKMIFKSSRLQGLKYTEIAEKLNISVKTVETQMGRALKHLRQALRSELPSVMALLLLICKAVR